MKKYILPPLLSLLLLWLIIVPVAASEGSPHVMDNAGLMAEEDVLQLEETAAQISNAYEMGIFILTVNSLNGETPEEYANTHLDYIADRHGDYYSGILFLLSMEERDWYISTCGDAIYVLTDYGIQQSAEAALPYLSSGDYYGGFCSWLDSLSVYLDAFAQGSPVDGNADSSGSYYHGTQESIDYYEEDVSPSFLLALLIGICAAGVTVAVMRGTMNTRRKQSGASVYMADNTYHLRTQRDIFLYSNVTRTARPKDTPSSGGGGSSVHRSASGRRHGGGGGKF